MNYPTPIVRWADNGSQVDLTIDLSDAKDSEIQLTETSLEFKSLGWGAHGENIYTLNIEFFERIDHKSSYHKMNERNISFVLFKGSPKQEWPRLLKSKEKPGWLRIDFDKWKIEESEEEPNNEDYINKISFEQRIANEVEKAKNDIKIFIKVTWLSVFNGFQALCYVVILSKLLYGLYKYENVVNYFYDDVSDLLLTCQMAALLEIAHPLLGLVNTGVIAPLLQNTGKSFVLFAMIVPIKAMHHNLAVYMVFVAWSASEVIRYPFYLVTLHRINLYFVAWLRYSAWIVLYPLGISCEVIILYQSIEIAETMRRWELLLPNSLNVSFSLGVLIRIWILTVLPVSMYLLKHMWILRQRKVGGKKKRKEKQM